MKTYQRQQTAGLKVRGRKSFKNLNTKKEFVRQYLNHFSKEYMIDVIMQNLRPKDLQILFTEAIKYKNSGGIIP